MNWKSFAALGALVCVSMSANAWEVRDEPSTMIFIRVPLDGASPKEQKMVWGLGWRGKKDYQVLNVDSQMVNNFVGLGILEAKWVLVGAVALGGAVAVANSGSKAAATQVQQQQQAQAAAAQQVVPGSASSGSSGSSGGCPPSPNPPCPR
jgi:hypothetical protein